MQEPDRLVENAHFGIAIGPQHPNTSPPAHALAERRWCVVTGNLDCFASGESLKNVVFQT
jgi:hypothetical protein